VGIAAVVSLLRNDIAAQSHREEGGGKKVLSGNNRVLITKKWELFFTFFRK
jgi:hypothetical protein